MDQLNQIADLLETELQEISKREGIVFENPSALTTMIAQQSFEIVPSTDKELTSVNTKRRMLSVVPSTDEPPEIVHYKSFSALNAIASLAAGVLGSSNPIILTASIISFLESIRGIRSRMPLAEALLYWSLYNSDGHRATREDAQEMFTEACKTNKSVDPAAFKLALQGLISLGCIKESHSVYQITDHVVLYWD